MKDGPGQYAHPLFMIKQIVILFTLLIILSCATDNKTENHEFFVFEPDIRLFTSYAFMNAAGYDHDWNETMHPIRMEIREYLDSILTKEYKIKINNYYQELGGGDFYGYGAYALNSNFPPEFGLICNTCKDEYLDKFVGYDTLLREFYKKAQIKKLWDKYSTKLREINLQYKPFAEIALEQLTEYCRVDSNYYRDIVNGHFYYQEIPLMSYFTAFFHETDNDYWIVSGPSSGEPGPGAFYHESLHRIINPIVESNSELNKKILDLVPLSQQKLQGNYNSDTSILCESFVRTIDKVLSSKYHKSSDDELYKMIENEYKLGHILCFYLMENLSEYENSDKTLEEFYPELISNIDIEFEINRWNNYWKNKQNPSLE